MHLHTAVVITRYTLLFFAFIGFLVYEEKKWAETKAKLSFEKCKVLAWIPWFLGLVVLKHLATGERKWLLVHDPHPLRQVLDSGGMVDKTIVLGQKAPPRMQAAHQHSDELELIQVTDKPEQSLF